MSCRLMKGTRRTARSVGLKMQQGRKFSSLQSPQEITRDGCGNQQPSCKRWRKGKRQNQERTRKEKEEQRREQKGNKKKVESEERSRFSLDSTENYNFNYITLTGEPPLKTHTLFDHSLTILPGLLIIWSGGEEKKTLDEALCFYS